MNTSTKLITVPIDYKNLKWVDVRPELITKSSKSYYQYLKKCIKNLEEPFLDQNQFLHKLDEASQGLIAFKQLIAFFVLGGRTEFAAVQGRISQLHLNLHYQLFANSKIFTKILKIKKISLSEEDQQFLKIIIKTCNDSGVNLTAKQKEMLKINNQEMTKLQLKYHKNIVKSQTDLRITLTRDEILNHFDKDFSEKLALKPNQKRETLFMDDNLYLEIINNCTSAKVRKRATLLHQKVASSGKNDNNRIMTRLLKLEKLAPKLLKYKSYNDMILSDRLLNRPSKVKSLLKKIHKELKPIAAKEVKLLELQEGKKIESSDLDFAQSKYRKQYYNLNLQHTNKYFSFKTVLNYLIKLNKELFGIELIKTNKKSYHKDILVYEVYDHDTKAYKGLAYLDVLPRKNKEHGAWATENHYNKETQEHVVSVAANFGEENSDLNKLLLDFEDIQTLFHEMGHLLHMFSTNGKYNIFCTEYVEWDFIELPSLLYERWLEDPQIVKEISCHIKTKAKLDDASINSLINIQKLFKATDYQYVVAKALLDLELHASNNIKSLKNFEQKTFNKYLPIAPFKGIQCLASYSHFFGAGYDMGFYSYVLSNVLSANAWATFCKNGIKDKATARRYKQQILSHGAGRKAQDQVDDFIGTFDSKAFIKSFKLPGKK